MVVGGGGIFGALILIILGGKNVFVRKIKFVAVHGTRWMNGESSASLLCIECARIRYIKSTAWIEFSTMNRLCPIQCSRIFFFSLFAPFVPYIYLYPSNRHAGAPSTDSNILFHFHATHFDFNPNTWLIQNVSNIKRSEWRRARM